MATLPKPDTSGDSGGPQFLKARDVGKLGARTRLVVRGNVRIEDSQFGEQCIMDVMHGRVVATLAIKTNSPNYRLLYDRFGRNTARWKGPIDVEVKHFANNDYIAIVDPSKPRTAAGKANGKGNGKATKAGRKSRK